MAKFIEIRSTAGEEHMVNTDHIFYIKAERGKINQDLTLHKIVLPDEVIWVTKPMYDKVKLELIEEE